MIYTRTEVKRIVVEAFEILIQIEADEEPEQIAAKLRERLREWMDNPVDRILDRG